MKRKDAGITPELIAEIDLMHELDAIKDKLLVSTTHQEPVALTPKEAQIVLSYLVGLSW